MARQSMHKAGLDPHIDNSEAPTEIWVPAQTTTNWRSNSPSMGKWLVAALLSLFILVLLLVMVFLGQLLYASALILPGVEVMGINVGSMTKTEAEAYLSQQWQQRSMLMTHEEAVWPVGAADLGFTLDAQAVIAEAYGQGRSLDSLPGLLLGEARIAPQWTFDSAKAAKFLEQFAEQVHVPALDAGLQIANGEVIESAAQDGRVLNVQMTLNQIQDNPQKVLQDGQVNLVMDSVSPQIKDVSGLVQEARLLLATQLTVQAFDPIQNENIDLIIEPQQWQQWMTLKVSESGADRFDWQVDEEAATAFFGERIANLGDGQYLNSEELLPQLIEAISNRQPLVDARIYHKPRLHIVQSGDTLSSIGRQYGMPYPWIQDANPGADSLRPGDEIVIPSPDEMVPLPVVQNKRIVVSLSRQKTWVYENGQVKWEWPASTGIDTSPTSPGVFQIQTHEPNAYASNWDLWMPDFMGIYRPIPTSDFMNGFHGFPTRNGSTLLWTGDLGHQVTYGCILLSSENAAQLYEWAEDGVIVEVIP